MIELVPAIDMIEGKCVRLTQGDYDTQKIYNESPLEVAKQFQDAGTWSIWTVPKLDILSIIECWKKWLRIQICQSTSEED